MGGWWGSEVDKMVVLILKRAKCKDALSHIIGHSGL